MTNEFPWPFQQSPSLETTQSSTSQRHQKSGKKAHQLLLPRNLIEKHLISIRKSSLIDDHTSWLWVIRTMDLKPTKQTRILKSFNLGQIYFHQSDGLRVGQNSLPSSAVPQEYKVPSLGQLELLLLTPSAKHSLADWEDTSQNMNFCINQFPVFPLPGTDFFLKLEVIITFAPSC